MIKEIDNEVEIWVHADDAELVDAEYYSFDDGYYEERDWLLWGKNKYIAKLTLDKEELEKLIVALDFARFVFGQASTSLCEVNLSSMRFSMPGHIVSAAHIDEPWHYQENQVGNKFIIYQTASKLEVFSDGTTKMLLYTDYNDSVIKFDISQDVHKLREFKESLNCPNH